ncbi:uncharacterized protein PgNI_12237 [Pyricularia grisea]|uniref:Uncharacterized protein n=1 Tax=Pyricularia grisea TaxID=148305 RepID=A0A6P8AMS3_PYRGI|nr:uncharacterized protein PgNI_12237 [Pyricularia grisea]TLD03332.1 hypothetical protein PgNI_12237 [Pyricularia grisea]TLD11512.1 hypothetical protein PspLS_11466 [Pyricularia sp. CBS 133598]
MAPLVSANLRMSFDSKRPDDPGSTTSKVAMSQRRPRFFGKDVMILPLNLDPGPETDMKPVLKLELQVAFLEDDCALSMLYQFEI